MTLNAFLSALKTVGIKVTILDVRGDELIKFFSEGYESVESDILARNVEKFELSSASTITVTIADAP